MRVFILSQHITFANQLANALRQQGHFIRWLRDSESMDKELRLAASSEDVLVIDQPSAYRQLSSLVNNDNPNSSQLALACIGRVADDVADTDKPWFGGLALQADTPLSELICQLVNLHKTHAATRTVAPRIFAEHEFDMASRSVSYQGKRVYLTEAQIRVLKRLLQTPNQCVSVAQLTTALYQGKEVRASNTLPVIMNGLRKKFPNLSIQTFYNQGYQLNGY